MIKPLLKILLCLSVCATVAGSIFAQVEPALIWSNDGQQCIFQSQGQFFLVDIKSRSRQAIIVDTEEPEIKKLDDVWFGATNGQLVLRQDKKFYFLDWNTKEIIPVAEPPTEWTNGRARLSQDRGKDRSRNSLWLPVRRSPNSPNAYWRVRVEDNNLVLTSRFSERIALTDDATADHTFENVGMGTFWFGKSRGPDVRWSRNSEFLVAFQTRKPEQPRVSLIESSPQDRLQPKLKSFQYPKPGDDLPMKTLRLFSIEDQKEIPVSNQLFPNPWSLRFVRWNEGGKSFWLHYNERGHQSVRLINVDAVTGKANTLIEDSSDTFIHYSDRAKSVFELLADGSVLWASERSGWNHLYRFDSNDGSLINAVTTGNWNVKRIHKIDFQQQVVWFYAVGVVPNQDPYHEHFCRVNLDGSGFKVLTQGNGTHKVQLDQNDQYIVDSWSRIDHAYVTELRDAASGELIVELARQKSAAVQFGRRKVPTRFSAPGRDGKTANWGMIHWPINFDPDKSYPIVENIYAGPHDQHVPKNFRTAYPAREQISDAGMIVVQIDGMGTAWRSRSFHEVCFKNLRDAGFPDRIAWIKAAADRYPQMDISRVGIYGGSAGGQNAMAALLWHNDFYKVAVADCGCHDNRMDKIWWNEQWMGWPVDDSYKENSNTENAHLLKGHLMLTVGELDQNVDPASTTQVVRKLIEHDKDFEFVLIPGVGHGAGETGWARKKRLNFLKRHLIDQPGR